MKKLIAFLLVAVMCLPLVACTNEEEIKALNEKIESLEAQLDNNSEIKELNEKIESLEALLDNDTTSDHVNKILGTWETSEAGGISFTFNEDGTGTRNEKPIMWKYDSELSSYIICDASGQMVGINRIETDENGARYIQYSIVKLYHKDN